MKIIGNEKYAKLTFKSNAISSTKHNIKDTRRIICRNIFIPGESLLGEVTDNDNLL